MDENSFEKKPKKKIGIIVFIIVALLVIVAIVAGVIYLQFSKKPEKIFTKIVEDMFEMTDKENVKAGKIELELSAEIESDDAEIRAINEILKAVKLKSTTEIDVDKKILNENITAIYNGEQVISLDALIQNETIYLYLKDIYSKYLRINEEYLEEVDLSTLFETSTDTTNEDLLNDIKQIILDEIEQKELTQEKVELDGEKVQKSTLTLTPKELLEIVLKMMKKVYKYQPSEELSELVEGLESEIEYLDDTENYVDISIYTKGLKNEIIKAEAVYVEEDDDKVIVIEIEQKSDDETVVSFAINQNSKKVSGATELMELTINKEDENKGTIKVKVNVEDMDVGVTSAMLVIKYEVDYNATIEKRKTQNSIDIDDLTEEDYNEMMTNLQNNEILYSLIETSGLFSSAKKEGSNYNQLDDYNWNDDEAFDLNMLDNLENYDLD